MKVFKKIFGIMLTVALCLSLTACMSNGRDSVRPKATTQTNYLPEATMNPGVKTTQAPVAFDWVTGSGQIEANVSRISEIQDCRVVVTGSTALVGVKFADAYKGAVTERIREMVAAEVMKADPSIQTVAVTSESDDVEDIYEISDELRSGKPAEEVANDINEIVRNATTIR